MKLNRADQQELLGHPGGSRRLGSGAAQRWNPADHDYYERQWRTQRGAWGDADGVEDKLEGDVKAVIAAFRTKGAAAGLLEAQKRGVLEGARIYLSARAEVEENLAAMLARIRARLATRPVLADKLREAFVEARLAEVRKAGAANETPPQAVIDKPEVARKTIPRWVSFTLLTVALISLARSLK